MQNIILFTNFFIFITLLVICNVFTNANARTDLK